MRILVVNKVAKKINKLVNDVTIVAVVFVVLATTTRGVSCDELVFGKGQGQRHGEGGELSLEKSLNNLALVDQIYKDNLRQTELILECNQKLTVLEYELSRAANSALNLTQGQGQLFVKPSVLDNDSVASLIRNLKVQLIEYFK